jgi:hypothetical protein
MKTATAALFFLLSVVQIAFATGWVLQAPEVTYSAGQIIETKKSVELGSFASEAACNAQRSASVQELGRQAREIRDVKDRSTVLEAERELTLLFFIYSNSKCVPSP